MTNFTTIIHKHGEQGEKTGWTYIHIPGHIADEIKTNSRKGFRVKGLLDNTAISGLALLPVGGGDFILALNAELRKKLGKREGAMLKVQLEEDKDFKIDMPEDLYDCLCEEPEIIQNFEKMPKSHQNYYIKWLNTAKTDATRAKRIAMIMNAMLRGLDFGAMLRAERDKKVGS